VRRQAADQQARLGPRHPAVAAADSQMRETRQQVQDELARLMRAAAAEHERASAQEAAIERRVAALQAEARTAGEQAARLRELERDAATRRAVHDALLVRAREADAAPPARSSATRIIAPAIPPASPSSLPALIVVAASLLLGLGAGSGLAFAAERLDDRVRDIDRFAAIGGVPVLAVVPEGRRLSARRFRALAVAPDAASRKGRSLGVAYPSAERLDALYRLASALGIGLMGPSARTIVFTSPEPTDSRPACVVDLGLAVAAGGRGVVIVDADTRGRQLSRLLGAGDGGLVDVLEERASLADVALTDHLTGLKVVPLARATASRLARFAPSRIRAAVETTGEEPVDLLVDASDPHDHVIVPSVLALADATVMVVRNGHTRARTLQQAMAALRNSGVRVTGLVVIV
jgi:Mrp family chromosome partitioning ATPase